VAGIAGALFICGCGHSGTSLLASMYAAHPRVYVPLRETNTFLRPEQATERLAQLQAEAAAQPAPFLVEKTPRHVRALELMRALVPDARFVIVVRDGGDVMASLMRRGSTSAEAADRWIADTAVAWAERDARDVHVYRHEDLIEDVERTLGDVCTFAAIPYDEQMLRYHEQERLWFGAAENAPAPGPRPTGLDGLRVHNQHRSWQINQPIFDARGRGRATLSAQDGALLSTPAASEVLRAFGYEPL
jgi:hypothetical protein